MLIFPSSPLRRVSSRQSSSCAFGAALVDLAVTVLGVVRWLCPLGERVGRLHIVVSVDEQRRRARNLGTFAGHDGMCVAAEELDVATAQPPQLGCNPFSSRAAILVVCRQCRDRRNSQK